MVLCPQSMPGIWKHVPKWLLDPEGPVALRWGYALKFLPWALRFLAAGQENRIPAIADGMNALNRPNVDLYQHHLSGTGHENLIVSSMYVHIYRNAADADINSLAWRMRTDRDFPVQRISGDELREVEPDISQEYQAAFLLKDQARALSPGDVGKALAAKARKMGVRFERAVVRALKPRSGGGWVAEAEGVSFEAETLVVAAGAWSARLLAPLGFAPAA